MWLATPDHPVCAVEHFLEIKSGQPGYPYYAFFGLCEYQKSIGDNGVGGSGKAIQFCPFEPVV